MARSTSKKRTRKEERRASKPKRRRDGARDLNAPHEIRHARPENLKKAEEVLGRVQNATRRRKVRNSPNVDHRSDVEAEIAKDTSSRLGGIDQGATRRALESMIASSDAKRKSAIGAVEREMRGAREAAEHAIAANILADLDRALGRILALAAILEDATPKNAYGHRANAQRRTGRAQLDADLLVRAKTLASLIARGDAITFFVGRPAKAAYGRIVEALSSGGFAVEAIARLFGHDSKAKPAIRQAVQRVRRSRGDVSPRPKVMRASR